MTRPSPMPPIETPPVPFGHSGDRVAFATDNLPAMTRSERFWLGAQLGLMAVILVGMGFFARESIADPVEKLPVWRVLTCGPLAPANRADLAELRRCTWATDIALLRSECQSVERAVRGKLKPPPFSIDCIVDQQVLVRMRGGQIDGPPLSGIAKVPR